MKTYDKSIRIWDLKTGASAKKISDTHEKVLFICHGRTCGPADKASIYATFKTLL